MSGTDRTILIVDDLKIVTKVIERHLRTVGFERVHCAHNGEQALEAALSLKPDIIFLDIVMPKVTGLEVLPSIRSALPDAKIIMLTSLNELKVAKECKEKGANGYILKGDQGVVGEVLKKIDVICQPG